MTEPLLITTRPVLVSKPDAARMLAMSTDSFERYAMPELHCVRRGRLRLYRVVDLEAWAEHNAEPTL